MKRIYEKALIEILKIEDDLVRTSQEGSNNGGSGGSDSDELPLIPF